MSEANEDVRHFHSTLVTLKLRIGISPVSTLVLPIQEKILIETNKKSRLSLLFWIYFSSLPLHPIPLRVHPDRVGSFGGEEMVETL